MKNFIIASIAFSLFVVCPRMAGMVHIISKNTGLSIPAVVVAGTAFSLPLVYIMALVFGRWGLMGALAFCILTDIASSVVMSGIGLRAGIETLIIAIFVVIGVKVAPIICNIMGVK